MDLKDKTMTEVVIYIKESSKFDRYLEDKFRVNHIDARIFNNDVSHIPYYINKININKHSLIDSNNTLELYLPHSFALKTSGEEESAKYRHNYINCWYDCSNHDRYLFLNNLSAKMNCLIKPKILCEKSDNINVYNLQEFDVNELTNESVIFKYDTFIRHWTDCTLYIAKYNKELFYTLRRGNTIVNSKNIQRKYVQTYAYELSNDMFDINASLSVNKLRCTLNVLTQHFKRISKFDCCKIQLKYHDTVFAPIAYTNVINEEDMLYSDAHFEYINRKLKDRLK